jgi:hypothetical protein
MTFKLQAARRIKASRDSAVEDLRKAGFPENLTKDLHASKEVEIREAQAKQIREALRKQGYMLTDTEKYGDGETQYVFKKGSDSVLFETRGNGKTAVHID